MEMNMTDVEIRCSCGAFAAVAHDVSGKTGNRCVCYCNDCQAFAHFLGRADEFLDAHGGTDIFQMSPAQFQIIGGGEHLACMRLSPGGLLRWYAACCNTPLGNTLISPRLPFVGLNRGCFHFSAGSSADEALGPVRARVHGRFATGDTKDLDAHPKAPLGIVLRLVRLLTRWRLQGAHRRTPFHHASSGEPTREPRILSREERQALDRNAP
jgi:hypothetical protein